MGASPQIIIANGNDRKPWLLLKEQPKSKGGYPSHFSLVLPHLPRRAQSCRDSANVTNRKTTCGYGETVWITSLFKNLETNFNCIFFIPSGQYFSHSSYLQQNFSTSTLLTF
jgi:hypothetical protein